MQPRNASQSHIDSQSQKPLVLIADDERNAVILLTRIFERDGFAVENARDGETALEKALELRPDLILMDVQMPKLNGFEVTARLREDPATARIPVIFVTAAARDPSDVAHGFQLGADDYVRKPYNYHELLARAHSKMRARQLEDRIQRRNEELEALVRIGAEFNQRLALGELTNLIVLIAQQELGAEQVELYLFDSERHIIHFQDTSGMRQLEDAQEILNIADSVVSLVAQTGEPILISGQEDDPPTSAMRAMGLESAAAAPLYHHGQLLGILSASSPEPGTFDDSNLRLLRSIGEQAALAIRNAQYAQNLESMVEARTQELRAAQAQLIQTEKLAALGRLAAGVAHEVNNPLQPILNCLEVTIEDIEANQPVDAEVLRVAEREVQRIKGIVSRLLDFARPQSSERQEVDSHALVNEVLTLTQRQLERMKVNVITHFEPTAPLWGDAAQLKQVLLNLVLNAAESMPNGGSIRVMVYPENDGTALSISDTGMGMDEQTMAQIFEPFYSTKGEGTGLGLAVSYGIIQGHGGEIRVESHPGNGSRFTVWLPNHHE